MNLKNSVKDLLFNKKANIMNYIKKNDFTYLFTIDSDKDNSSDWISFNENGNYNWFKSIILPHKTNGLAISFSIDANDSNSITKPLNKHISELIHNTSITKYNYFKLQINSKDYAKVTIMFFEQITEEKTIP